jgi:hypothetical protein
VTGASGPSPGGYRLDLRSSNDSAYCPTSAPPIYHENMDEPAEVFDDMYLGLQAGVAGRKRRRGEELSAEEHEALGRWERLSRARKTLAIGGFVVGTFGLGFAVGGLVFGRRRGQASA